jgi:hypothetical protein
MNMILEGYGRVVTLESPLVHDAVRRGSSAIADVVAESRERGLYVPVRQVEQKNLFTYEGVRALMDGLSSSALSFYIAPFTSDSTPLRSWDGDFGAASGGVVTEFTGYDEATRPEIEFGAATGDAVSYIVNGTAGTLTVSTGQNPTIYGLALTNNSTKQYDSGSAVLYEALRFDSEQSWTAGQVQQLYWQINFTVANAS